MAKVIPDNIFTQDKPKECSAPPSTKPVKKKQLRFKHLDEEAQEFMQALEWLSNLHQTGSALTVTQ